MVPASGALNKFPTESNADLINPTQPGWRLYAFKNIIILF